MIFFFRKMTIFKLNYEVDEQEILARINFCKKWRHYIENFKYFVRIIIDHANLKNLFINKNLNRRKIRWWERLTKFNLKIEYRFDKNNLANDLFRRRDYENQTAKENKFKNENLNLKKWTLIENNAFLKNKNEKKQKKKFFLCRNWYVVSTNANSNSSKTQKTINETLRNNCLQNKNQNSTRALNSIAKISQKKMKIVTIVKKILKKKIVYSLIHQVSKHVVAYRSRDALNPWTLHIDHSLDSLIESYHIYFINKKHAHYINWESYHYRRTMNRHWSVSFTRNRSKR
jgi:hypothetical protein